MRASNTNTTHKMRKCNGKPNPIETTLGRVYYSRRKCTTHQAH